MANLVIQSTVSQFEIRTKWFSYESNLDADGEPGTPGKHSFRLLPISEPQDANGKIAGVRTERPVVSGDLMNPSIANKVITRNDGTTFIASSIYPDMFAFFDSLKAGI